MTPDEISLIRPADRVPGPPTPGMTRHRAIETGGMWSGYVRTEPGMASGWHHHGEFESSIFVVSGAVRMEYGPGGARALVAGPGDFLFVPRGVVHREINPAGEPADIIVTRSGHGESTVNVEGPDPA